MEQWNNGTMKNVTVTMYQCNKITMEQGNKVTMEQWNNRTMENGTMEQ